MGDSFSSARARNVANSVGLSWWTLISANDRALTIFCGVGPVTKIGTNATSFGLPNSMLHSVILKIIRRCDLDFPQMLMNGWWH